MKYEIEVKARVSDIELIKTKLSALGCVFADPLIQHDFVYNIKGADLGRQHKTPVLRIRKQNGIIIFTLKQDRKNELDCIEKETKIDNAEMMVDIIEMLGYEKTLEIKKTRIKTVYRDYEICIDDVENLGTFIEVEKMSSEDAGIVQSELFDFLQTIGVKKEDQVFSGYDTLLWQKMQR